MDKEIERMIIQESYNMYDKHFNDLTHEQKKKVLIHLNELIQDFTRRIEKELKNSMKVL